MVIQGKNASYQEHGKNMSVLQGVVGVVTRSVPDVLCHAAVRARNSATLLAACCDEEELASLAALDGQQVVMQTLQVIEH